MLHVYHSNRLEALLALLCSLRDAAPLADPIVAETVLVANPGIGRWLNLKIAEREGIAANIDYRLPATFVWQVYRDCLDNVPEQSAFEKGPLRLRVLGLLQRLSDHPDPVWRPVQRYLQIDDTGASDARLAQLAGRVADVFDQYLVYRPQMLLDWETGADHAAGGTTPVGRDLAWQPALWRALREGSDEPHRATLWRRFCAAADRGQIDGARLPTRLHLFNVGLLPPSTLDVLVRLARVDMGDTAERVSLYFLNPAVDYWADLVDMRRRARERLTLSADVEPLADDTLGNPLLASLGGTGQTLLRLLGERSEWVHDEQFFLPSAEHSLLAALQRDMLHPFEAHQLSGSRVEDDPSIQFHGHYSAVREVQALHDQLLQRFNGDASLEPADVLVMVPDINSYAPVIEAVFGSVGGPGDARARHVPWSIADRSLTGTAPVIALVSRLFELPNSEFEASEVLGIASERAVARRFGFDDNGLGTVQQWLLDSGIRRGLAGAHDSLFGARDAALNTWDFGLRRLLLGRAVPDDSAVLGECEPWPHVDGEHAGLLSQLLNFLDALQQTGRELAQARTVSGWVDAINDLIERMVLPDEDEADALAQLRELLAALDADAESVGESVALSHDGMRELLRDTLASATRKHHRYLTGRVTFSSMVPLRSVPFRMVCLLGMNDGAFPRQRQP
ncbi:MAG: exodeoxyribonuclease V subunit gamma, partial [Pseudomonadota bacterium]